MFRMLLICTLLLGLSSCMTSPEDANKALRALGFTDVQYTGYSFFSCGKGDWYHTGFTARNVNGELVSGTVCSGLLFKQSTVRFD